MSDGAQRKNGGDSNGLGIAGFVISLVGLCSGGLLSPIGLILSLVALGREPRGLAIAGVVIGALGSCGIIISLIFLPLVIVGVLIAAGATAAAVGLAAALGGPELEAFVEMQVLTGFVQKYEDQNGSLPASLADAVGQAKATSGLLLDPWGNAYVFVINPDGTTYQIFSAGPDGAPGTADDVQKDNFRWPKQSGSAAPAAPAAPSTPESSGQP